MGTSRIVLRDDVIAPPGFRSCHRGIRYVQVADFSAALASPSPSRIGLSSRSLMQ